MALAGAFGFGLHRQLMALGVQHLVAQPICLDEPQEKRLIIFVIAHTYTLGAAAIILEWDDHTLLSRRRNYQIPTPPPEQNKSLLDSANVTSTLPGSPARTFQLAQLLPWPPQLPDGDARAT